MQLHGALSSKRGGSCEVHHLPEVQMLNKCSSHSLSSWVREWQLKVSQLTSVSSAAKDKGAVVATCLITISCRTWHARRHISHLPWAEWPGQGWEGEEARNPLLTKSFMLPLCPLCPQEVVGPFLSSRCHGYTLSTLSNLPVLSILDQHPNQARGMHSCVHSIHTTRCHHIPQDEFLNQKQL